MQIHIEKDELWVELGPPVPQREVIYAASSSDITSWDSDPEMATAPLSLPFPLPVCGSTLLCPISGSQEPVCGASHNIGWTNPTPTPMLDQHLSDKITKEYCFHSGLCKL